MKKLKKFLLLASLVVGFTTSLVMATDGTATITGATITSLVSSQAIHLTSLEVINNHPTAAMTIYFYDAPTNVLTWTRGAYTNWTAATETTVVTTTNYQGVVETATNSTVTINPNAVAGGSQSFKLFKTFTIAAGATATWNPANGVYLSYGLAATNNATNLVVNYSYSTLR